MRPAEIDTHPVNCLCDLCEHPWFFHGLLFAFIFDLLLIGAISLVVGWLS